jgi:membrane protease subunit (stomatin/prohibitin family)
VAVNEGQCMILVDQGKVTEVCAEPGEFVYDESTEPSIFYGGLDEASIMGVLSKVGERFAFGGQAPKDQRVYFINTKEIVGNKYGTPSPVPFRVVDANIGLDVDISVRCFGEYSYRIVNPILFFTNVCGNVEREYSRAQIDGQLKTELLTALQPAFARISEMGIRYSALPGHTTELAQALNEALSEKWADLRGIVIVSFGVSSVKASEEDEAMIKELQRNATFRNPNMAAAHLVGAQAQAMQDAARNEGGAFMGFMGMNAAQGAGGASAQSLFQMGAQQAAQQAAQPAQPAQPAPQGAAREPEGWKCGCGHVNTGKFCKECGAKKPDEAQGWKCGCGHVNTGKFCAECGERKPEGAKAYRCDKCGWEPADKANPPKFCPECGDVFDERDAR